MLWLAGCGMINREGEQQAEPTPTTPALPVQLTVAPASTAAFGPPDEALQRPSQLRLWVPPEIGSRTQGGADVLTSQLREFNARYPEMELVVEQKPVAGPGGILDYLRSGRDIAPSVLPDLVALPTSYFLDPSVRELVMPLEELVDTAAFDDLYPAATAYVRSDQATFGYPFALAGLTHLVSAPDVITRTVPIQWSQFISETQNTLLLPADSRDGALFGLQFYLANGGTLTNDLGRPDLQVEPLALALEQIQQGKANLAQSYQLKSLDEAWQLYQMGASSHVWTRSDFLLARLGTDEEGARGRSYGAAPGPEGALTPLVNAWAWAITTTDEAQQQLAADLLLHLVDGANALEWARQSQVLPASRSAAAALAGQDPYYAFAGQELERAEPMPGDGGGRLLDAIGAAVYQVLSTEADPRAVADETVARLRQ